MRKRVRIAVAVLVIGFAGVVGLRMFYARNREPVYQGKALTVWLNDYLGWDTTPGEWAQAKNKAECAVRQIGTNAIPSLLQLVRETNSGSMSKLVDVWDRRIETIGYFPFWVRHPAWYKHQARYLNTEGEVGFKILGADARGAVPELMNIYKQIFSMDSVEAIDRQYAVSRALIDIGPPAIPSLLSWAASTNENERLRAVSVLSQIHGQGSVLHRCA
jgi:hypothetical protein